LLLFLLLLLGMELPMLERVKAFPADGVLDPVFSSAMAVFVGTCHKSDLDATVSQQYRDSIL